jgi:ABC-type dipeptide/oligopeptide/nickel transport system permease component
VAKFIIARLIALVPVVFGILVATFLLKAMLPSDAANAMFEGQLSDTDAADAISNIRAKYGLDLPWYEQFASYVGNIAHGDLGESIRTRHPVLDEIGFRYVNTLMLTIAALAVALLVGVGSGIVSAYKKGTWLDVTSMTVSLVGISMPAFFFGISIILVFSVWLKLTPVIPRGEWAIVMPALTLGLIEAAPIARIMRSNMLEILGRDYIRAARANGVPERAILFRHALPNSLLTVVTLVGLQFGHLLGGAFIIELIFGWRGIGELAVRAILWRDFPLTQAIILVSAATYVLINLLTDILYAWIDPRIEYEEA